MKVFPHGQGDGAAPTQYLVRPDYPGRDSRPPTVLRGDVEMTRELINSLDTKWKFTAGVLSWHPDDTITPEQEQHVMDDFERVAFAGLEPDQRHILWVRHSHAGHHELHFVIPRVELSSGKAFNPCPPGWQKCFDVLRDLHNIREGWASPDDPAHRRMYTPEHTSLHKARLLRWGKAIKKDERDEAKEAIHAYVLTLVEQQKIHERQDVFIALQEAGLEITRTGKDYITVKDPESGHRFRLKGGMYGEQFDYTGRTLESQNREREAGGRGPDPAELHRLESELERVIERRAAYNRNRYPRQSLEYGEEPFLTMPDYGPAFQSPIPAGAGVEHGDSAAHHRDGMGADHARPLSDYGTGKRDNRLERTETDAGRGLRRSVENIQGTGSLSRRGAGLPADGQRLEHRSRGHRGQTGRLAGGEEVSHDRTGTDAERQPAHSGAGNERRADTTGEAAQRPAGTAESSGWGYSGAAPGHSTAPDSTTGVRTALAALERCVQGLRVFVDQIERAAKISQEKLRKREWVQQHARLRAGM